VNLIKKSARVESMFFRRDYYDRNKIVLRAVILGICFLPGTLSQTSLAQDRGAGAQSSGTKSPAPDTGQGQQEQGKQQDQKEEKQTSGTALPEASKEVRKPTGELAPTTPEGDTEFQNFVAKSLGFKLPLFGKDLFRNVPSTFAPLDRIPVSPDYIIGPGDELLIRTWGQIDSNYSVIVDRTGSIGIPKVGNLTVAGLRYDELHDFLKAAFIRVFRDFELSVTLGQLRSIQVYVVGQARRPGVYTISSLSTLIDAVFASGGPSNLGSMRQIQLKRHNRVVTVVDLYDLISRGDKSKDAQLLPGDVIFVPPAGRLVALSGSISIPAVFELRDGDTLGDVIGYAGGLTTVAETEQAIVERIDRHHARKADEFPLTDAGLRRELQDGDVVRFLSISSRFDNAVTLRGNVARPGRYPWRNDMRVRDLIPNRDFLITEEYWNGQNLLALRPSDQREIAGAGTAGSAADLKNEIKRESAEIDWQYAVIQRLDTDDLSPRLFPFNLGKAIEGDQSQNLPLLAGDVIIIFSQKDMHVPIAEQTKLVHLEGEFRPAGVYRADPGETLRHLIKRVGVTEQAYLYGAEFTRESTRVDQQRRLDEYLRTLEQTVERQAAAPRIANSTDETLAQQQRVDSQRRLLEKLRQLKATGRIVFKGVKPDAASLDAFPDLVLEDNDRLFIPFRPATVSVIGSVYNNSAFVFEPSANVANYVKSAGGVTQDGDRKRTFVIRANGSTVGNQERGLLAGSLENLKLMPGDTVIVPEKLDRGAALRGFRDWAQILSQFALGAAAATIFTK
jgi:polysaccharide export outer membrane protein